MSVAGAKRTAEESNAGNGVGDPAAAAAASDSRVTTRSQARAMADQPTPLAATAASVALSAAAADAAAATPSSSSSAAFASAAVPPAAAAPSPSRAAPFVPACVPPRRADPPSLFCAKSPDPLSLIPSFVLIDLPIATGQPYFPKELVRIVHEYASEACFIVQLTSDDGADVTHSISRSSSASLLVWLGEHLSGELQPNTATDDDGDELWSVNEEPAFKSHCDCCLMDEQLRIEDHEEIALLLHAQLEDNEYRMCYREIEPNEDGQPFDPAEYAHRQIDLADHSQFCLAAIGKRRSVIVARGQKPVAVGLSELLERVRSSLLDGELPCGLSPRACDWAPLFWWIRSSVVQLNETRANTWWSFDRPAKPVLSAVLVQSTTKGAPVSIQGEACLWSSTVPLRLLMRPAASMLIDEGADDDAAPSQPSPQYPARFAGLSPLSASAPRVSSLSADEESAARAAPRQRR